MANSNDPQNYEREVSKEIHNNTDGRVDVTKTTETVSGANAYKDGFVNGQVAESYQEDALVARDNENAGRGLLIGILLASLAAITAGAVWFANQSNNNDVNNITPLVVPVPNRAEPSPSPEIRTETKIIEKTKEVLVPVRQQQAAPKSQPSVAAPEQNVNITVPPVTAPSPAAKQAPAPNVNITVPPVAAPSPAAKQAPVSETAPTKSDTSSSPDMQSTTPTESSAGGDPAPSADAPATSGSSPQ